MTFQDTMLTGKSSRLPKRDYYIDRIRVLMTALVLFHHAAITYGASGGWFYREVLPSRALSSLLLTLFCAVNQAYFMGFFFLLAGYYTPSSLERKGYARFLLDRFLRLGIPLLAFGFLLAPLSIWLADLPEGGTFPGVAAYLWRRRQFENGPLWFAQALLIFTLVYCGWRAGRGPLSPKRIVSETPRDGAWTMLAITVGLGALAIRQFSPVGQTVFGLQLGYFSSYIALFAIGIAAWRHGWVDALKFRQAKRWLLIAAIAIPLLPAALLAFPGGSNAFAGGLSMQAVLYAFWEPFVAWGLIAGWLILMRKYCNRPSRLWDWLGRRAYAVYIVHPPVLVDLAVLLRTWHGPVLLKFTLLGSVTCAASWAVSEVLVRVPGIRRVV